MGGQSFAVGNGFSVNAQSLGLLNGGTGILDQSGQVVQQQAVVQSGVVANNLVPLGKLLSNIKISQKYVK